VLWTEDMILDLQIQLIVQLGQSLTLKLVYTTHPPTHHHKLLDHIQATEEAQIQYESLFQTNRKKYEEKAKRPFKVKFRK
jgi:hypothetical protein